MKLTLHLFLLLFATTISAQSFVNGSFESTTASMYCEYNLDNASFNSMMSSVIGYGVGEELDILIAGCYNPSIPDGVRAVGLAASPSDEISIPVSPALVAGQSYSFTFRAYAEMSFRPRGDIQIGASTSASAFGTLIFTGVTNASAWRLFTVSFIAPNNATHITVRNIVDGVIHWNHVDDFRFVVLLPIQIQRFEAKLVEKEVLLNWETESEQNNDYFDVEHSLDAVEWTKIDKVDGAGNSNVPRSYQSIDKNPVPGVNYYRLAQVDFDGNSTYSDVVAIEYLSEAGDKLRLHPNPTGGILNITMATPQDISSVSIIDALGQLVRRIENSSTQIDMSDLPAGVYWIKIELQNGSSLSKKVQRL